MNIKTTLKSSVAAAALLATAVPVATAPSSAEAADDTFSSGNKNMLKITGQVGKAIWYADDGTSDGVFISDNITSRSRVRWIATGNITEAVSVGAFIESDIPLSNRPSDLTLGSLANDGTESRESGWAIRHQYVWVSHKKLGKLRLGNSDGAANGTAEANLSGTGSFHNNAGAQFGTGIAFIEKTGGLSVSGQTVGNTLTNNDGRSRTDVLRYDTPKFFGLGLSVSYDAGGAVEGAARYNAKFGPVKVKVRAGYTNISAQSTTVDDIWAISAAAIHDSGVNFSISYGEQGNQATGRNDNSHFYWSVGYRAKIFGVGSTDLNFGWNNAEDVSANGDDADAISFTVVQRFDSVGTQMQFSYYNHSLDQPGRTFDDVDVVGLAMLVAF